MIATKQRIWTKDFIALTIGNFMSAIVFYLLMTSIAVYTVQRFHTNKSMAGFAVSIFLIGALLSRICAGKYMDVVGRKKMLVLGAALNVLIMIAYFFVNSVVLLLAVRILHGLSFGVTTTVIVASALAALPDGKRGEGNAYFSLSVAAGTAVGPFMALFLTERYSYTVMFAGCMIFSVLSLCFILSARIVEAEKKQPNEAAENRKDTENAQATRKFSIWSILEKNAMPIALIMLVGGISYASVISFLNAYSIELGLTDAASVYYVIYAITLFVGRPIAGRLYDRKGENIVIFPSFAAFILCYVFLSVTHSAPMLLLSAACLALGYGTMMSTFQTLIVQISPPHRMGLAISTYFICLDIGNGLGGFIVGGIVDAAGFRVMYLIVACMLAAMVPLYWVLHGRRK